MTSTTGAVRSRWILAAVSMALFCVQIDYFARNLQQVRARPAGGGAGVLGPSACAALGGAFSGRLAARRPPVLVMGVTTVLAAASLAVLAASRGWAIYLPALTAWGLTLGLVCAFTTVATQAVVRPERAGEAAGVTLTSLVTLAGVGVAVSGMVLEILSAVACRRAVRSIWFWGCWRPCCCPAGVVVLLVARSRGAALSTEPSTPSAE